MTRAQASTAPNLYFSGYTWPRVVTPYHHCCWSSFLLGSYCSCVFWWLTWYVTVLMCFQLAWYIFAFGFFLLGLLLHFQGGSGSSMYKLSSIHCNISAKWWLKNQYGWCWWPVHCCFLVWFFLLWHSCWWLIHYWLLLLVLSPYEERWALPLFLG